VGSGGISLTLHVRSRSLAFDCFGSTTAVGSQWSNLLQHHAVQRWSIPAIYTLWSHVAGAARPKSCAVIYLHTLCTCTTADDPLRPPHFVGAMCGETVQSGVCRKAGFQAAAEDQAVVDVVVGLVSAVVVTGL